ncbi:MAG: PKD domain-containing protein [Candidatus Pacearchaeota archaeon]
MKIKKRKKRASFLMIFLILLLIFPLVLATFEKGVPSLVINDVGPKQLLSGYLNVSFENESGGDEIRAELDGNTASFSLLEFMKRAKGLGISFNCSYEGKSSECELQYKDASSSDTFQGNAGGNYVGLVISGKSGVEITNLSFIISGSLGSEECTTEAPFIIDLFNDGTPDYYYLSAGLSTCGEKYNENYTAKETANIGTSFICDTVKLEYKSARVKIGGNITLENYDRNASVPLYFKIARGGKEVSCNTTYDNGPSCDLNFNVYPGEYEICVRAGVNDNYIISAGSEEEGKQHFALFAAEYKNQPFAEEIQFNSTLYAAQTGKNLIDELNTYLQAKYNKNCSAKCIIPLYINSTVSFSFTDLRFKYKSAGIEYTMPSFSTLQREFPLITTAGYVAIPLAAFNITAPNTYGNYSLRIVYKGTEIDKKSFKVVPVPVVAALIPLDVIVNEPTTFRAIAYSPKGLNITSYSIDFGDSVTTTSSDGIFIHTYTQSKLYNVKVEATDSQGFKGTNYFTVNVGVPIAVLNSTINKAINSINNFETKLGTEFYATWLKNMTNTANLKAQLLNLSSRIVQVGDNITALEKIKSDYDAIKANIPTDIISYINYPQLKYIINWNEINKGLAESVAGSCPLSEDECKKAIALWTSDNVDINIKGEKKKIVYQDGNSKVLTIVDVNIIRKTSADGKLILALDSTKLFSSTQFESKQAGIATNLASFKFAYLDNIDPYKISVFAVPINISNLQPVSAPPPVGRVKPRSRIPEILFILIAIILVGGLIFIWRKKLVEIYTTLSKKRKLALEKKLFPTKADYYNIINFISKSFSAGMSEAQIKQKLLSAGWKDKQVNYAMKEVKKQIKKEKKL